MITKEKIWSRGDLLTGLTTGLAAFAVYVWTVAPNVTLLDSGEFIVAAQHFGVPHPTGYPLWTLLTWLFTLLPLGNAAWEVNLFSSVCGGLAAALLAALTRSSLRWLMEDDLKKWPGLLTMVSITCGLLFAFSFSMWSQATIAEVYTLHALLIGAYLAALYCWLRCPDNLGTLLLAFFLLALSFSNHHLSIAMCPLPFLAVLLVRKELFWDLLVASLVTALIAYLGFAILSNEAPLLKTALRFAYFVCAGLLLLAAVRRLRIEWRLIAYLPFAVALGLLPYAYMPVASSTNPPMNWSYTSTPEGFYYAFNRSQYGGSLAQQSLRTLGRFLGTVPASEKAPPSGPEAAPDSKKPFFVLIQEWAGYFWIQLGRSFTPIGILGYFGALFLIFRLRDVARRTWIYLLEFGFVLAAFLQPMLDGAGIDAAGWWLQMPYHSYTNFLFALLAALGIAFGASSLFSRVPRIAGLRHALILLPLVPLAWNYDGCSQRDRWFGWQFGHDMLKDLPRGSVIFGGTDPGRFVPTYMILGESGQDRAMKRDPDFDRRDLYIITQNGVGEPLYRKYIADHYGPDRPAPRNSFEKWLGRAETYPDKPLQLPSESEIQEAIAKEMAPKPGKESPGPAIAHSVVTRLIWEKNRDKHDFFVEESYPLEWSYDHAIPRGLIYQINKDPLKEIPEKAVQDDFAFWRKYISELLGNPDFKKDFDARRSFSKLRSTTGNLYRHRKMDKEAEKAYREALLLWPGNPESLQALTTVLWERGDFDDLQTLLDAALEEDPNNRQFLRLWVITEQRKSIEGEIIALKSKLVRQPRSRDTVQNLLKIYTSVADTNKASELLDQSIITFQDDPDFLRTAAAYAESNKFPKAQLAAVDRLASIEPLNPENHFLQASAAFASGDKKAFFSAAAEAIRTGGEQMRDAVVKNPAFSAWEKDPEFQALSGNATGPGKVPEPSAPAATPATKPPAAETNADLETGIKATNPTGPAKP